jgi:hypothetical protein
MFVKGSGRNEQSLQRTFHRCFLPSFGSFGQAVSEEKIFFNRPIRNKSCLWQPCLLMDRDKMSKLYSLFAENGVIVRNLNYRPWQWVYSISGCKSFPGGF